MTKQELVAKATSLGITDAEKLTVAQLAEQISAKEKENGENNGDGNPPPPPLEQTGAQLPPTPPTPPAEEKKAFEYPVYDLWKVDVDAVKKDKDDNAKQVKFTAVKIVRENVKIEDSVAETLNAQSHNSQRRYYKKGTKNGFEETVTIQ